MNSVRPYAANSSRERAQLYRICLRTGGAGGEDASGLYSDPELVGHVYVGPYLRFAPELAFVAEDDDGVGGYVLGVADTRAFASWCEREWWPALRRRYPPPADTDRSLDATLIRHIHAPPAAPAQVLETYPAHLHIDLLPRLQGHGTGRRVLDALFGALRARDVAGIHLEVGMANWRAIGFYRAMGFEDLDRTSHGLVMGRPLLGAS